jgi:hypothetical protein
MIETTYELSEEKQIPTLAEVRERYGNELKQLGECDVSDCQYSVVLSNRALAAFHVVPYTEMESYFSVRNGLVTGNMVNYTTRVGGRYSVTSHVQIDFCDECRTYAIDPWGDSLPSNANGIVETGNRASATGKRTALSLNTSCLVKTGCNSIAELLPAVWRKTTNNKVACNIQNHTGRVEKWVD